MYSGDIHTIIETPLFSRYWPDYWTEEERGEFAAHLAENPEAGDVVQGSGGCRKVRWQHQGKGKSGGVRVIYFNRLASGKTVLLLIYAKSAQDNIAAHILKQLMEANHAND